MDLRNARLSTQHRVLVSSTSSFRLMSRNVKTPLFAAFDQAIGGELIERLT